MTARFGKNRIIVVKNKSLAIFGKDFFLDVQFQLQTGKIYNCACIIAKRIPF